MAEETVTPRPEWNAKGADHDQPFKFGGPLLVNEMAHAWLLLLRSRIRDGEFADDHPPHVPEEGIPNAD